MTNKSFFSPYLHYLIYTFSAIVFALFLGVSAFDDGLRHISFALNKDILESWGNVFPHSLFSEYDPWFGWHFLLNKLLYFFSKEETQIVVNFLGLFLFMILIDKFIREYVKYKLDSFTYIIVFIIVVLTSYRYVMVRPDMLSGFYIMLMLLVRNKFLPALFITIIYGPFYYLFFLYTGSIGLVYLIQQKWKSFIGTILGTLITFIFFFVDDFDGYTNTVYNVLIDQKLRMGLEVSEGRPIFDFLTNLNYFILLPIFLIGSFLLIYKNYKYFKSNTLATFLLITSILWMNQYRYYHLFLPLIFVYLISIIFNSRKKYVFYYLRKYQVLIKRFFSYSKGKKIFFIIALPYSIFILGYMFSNQTSKESIERGNIFIEKRFNNKVILSNIMNLDMYSGLYHNPTIKVVPSCSIGWFYHENKDLKEIYVKMMKLEGITEEELKRLVDATNADYYLHYFNRSKRVLSITKLKELGIEPNEIYVNKILFKVKK
ncbi:hypothetical protein [Arcobacter arenosus]|uniref:Glycosyltransferase RgtA/B/C/D-like domain-containing protein n=1 Tax=Arcobacter arenosus TaxID=2576037 RepID=A0A5R8Y3G1_9BACT|nr:hypothetical protein [Arcobacter arenosus]TLP39619.1 hypothetical protein FDK22_07050 [Arcobacter arenosus]